MKYIPLLALLLTSCSSLPHLRRDIAGTSPQIKAHFEFKVDRPVALANGADVITLTFKMRDDSGQEIVINPDHLKLIHNNEAQKSKIVFEDGFYKCLIRPAAKSPSFKIAVLWKKQASAVFQITTSLKPQISQLKDLNSDSRNMAHVSGLNYRRQSNFPEGQFEGFSISNKGLNSIVRTEDSSREFDFLFEEQATQNISMMVTDSPNTTISHMMHSYFMFFPRIFIPVAEVNDRKEVKVTLPNGEEMHFAENRELIDGVFREGPVDTGPDRFKRSYADLKYQGKGVLLRANARGQMPQQGQFESTKIDMDYGIKYSNDVLIINGSTGERCRRPKSDFWSSADVSPILFKYPTDEEFNKYLKAKCGFTLPEMEEVKDSKFPDPTRELEDVWKKCESSSEVERCLSDETEFISDKMIKSQVKFENTLRIMLEKAKEEKIISVTIQKQMDHIKATLLQDAAWVSKGCQEKSKDLVHDTLRYHDLYELMKDQISSNCTTIKSEMETIAKDEAQKIKKKLESDFSWATLAPKEKVISDCMKSAKTHIDSSFKYNQAPEVYQPTLTMLCANFESLSGYDSWLSTQSAGLKEKVYAQIIVEIEKRADTLAQQCVEEHAKAVRFVRNQLIERCIMNGWDDIEQIAIDQAKEDPMVQKVSLSFSGFDEKIKRSRRLMQLRVIKKYLN